ncbi:MAG: hypothetical protein IJ635_08450 [Bacteroidaceae bacterium]|nr:hypothetical protein [Bacteroidaceae bacterium]
MKRILLIGWAVATWLMAQAQGLEAEKPRLPRFFASGMVVQRDVKVPVWGWGVPGRRVTVKMQGKKAVAMVGEDGTWRVELPRMKAGGPYVMEVGQTDMRSVPLTTYVERLENVLVGDVFLCSGQSNMELPIRRCMDVVREDVKDYRNSKIRYLKLPHQFNYVRPNDDVAVLPWQDITPENCGEVSGICYFMARELQEREGVPVGIVNSAVGGTQVQAWMPREVLSGFDGYAEELGKRKYHQVNWVDSIRRLENEAGMAWEREMMAKDTIVNRWKSADYAFEGWQTVDLFSDWSKGRNGSYWFRTSLTLPEEVAGRRGVLRFGAMKDADTIYVNGQAVGNTTYEYPPRVYAVKEGILRAGKNDIVVHLMSQSGRANFTKGKLYQLEVEGQTFPISEQLQMAVGSVMPRKPASTYFVDTPTGLYNAMIAPLRDWPVKGVLWYQGESNVGSAATYAAMLEAMVQSWRGQWGKELPVVIMQLPGYMSRHNEPVETGWTQIRHQQYLAAKHLPNAALAPTFDTGEYNDIHPQDKRTAGHRAALQMRKLAYGERQLVSGGPMPVAARVKDGAVVIKFAKDGGRLTVKGDALRDFAVKVNGKYQWAEAKVTDERTVTVTLPEGVTETTVRYGWDDYPTPTLYNVEGIPAPQFEIEARGK